MTLFIFLGESIIAQMGTGGTRRELDSRHFLKSCIGFLHSNGMSDFSRLDGVALLFGDSKFTVSRQIATAVNGLAFVFGIPVTALRAAALDEDSITAGVRALGRRSARRRFAIPRYHALPHITKPGKKRGGRY